MKTTFLEIIKYTSSLFFIVSFGVYVSLFLVSIGCFFDAILSYYIVELNDLRYGNQSLSSRIIKEFSNWGITGLVTHWLFVVSIIINIVNYRFMLFILQK